MSETGQYRLVFKLSNGLSFEAWICKDSRYIQILESTYFELDFDNINTIIKTIEQHYIIIIRATVLLFICSDDI